MGSVDGSDVADGDTENDLDTHDDTTAILVAVCEEFEP